jgi:lysophospholipase L1-like esterase
MQEETDAELIWASTTPVNEEWHHRRKAFDRFQADVLAYNRQAAQVAAAVGVAVNDLYAVVTNAGRDGHLAKDGVHFTPSGYALLGRAVAGAIRSVLQYNSPRERGRE